MSFTDTIVESAQEIGWELGCVILTFCSGIEYLFPPFPGDTSIVIGAVLIPLADWPWPAVFLATITGSSVGGLATWRVGRWVDTHPTQSTWVHKLLAKPRLKRRIDQLLLKFEQHGYALLVANRFIPGFRSVFFISAGISNLPMKKVALCSMVSAALYNAVLLALGVAVGFNVDRLMSIVTTYSEVVFVLVLVGFGFWLYKQKTKEDDEEKPNTVPEES